MNDWTANLSEVVAEVRELFERYEQALIEKDLETSFGASSRMPISAMPSWARRASC